MWSLHTSRRWSSAEPGASSLRSASSCQKTRRERSAVFAPDKLRWCACARTHTQSSYSPYFKNWGDLTHIRYRIESHVATGRCGESLGQSWRLRLALTSIPGSDMIFLRLWLWERAETARHETTQCSSSCKPQSGSLCVCMHARMATVTTEAAGPRCPFSQHLRARYAISIFRSFTNQAS